MHLNVGCVRISPVGEGLEIVERGPERRSGLDRRLGQERRFSERRGDERASENRRTLFPFDRRVAERRFIERRSFWPEVEAY